MILINVLGIQDSGGITVLEKLLDEIKHSLYNYLIVCNQNENIDKLYNNYKNIENLQFLLIPSRGFFYRLYFENVIFRKIIKVENIVLVYNFSGSAQFFLKVPQITKVQNLLFYSKKINQVYFDKKKYFNWFKQIFLKRTVFHMMIAQSKYIEVQSSHVKEYMNDFIDISQKKFFIKSDISVKDELFQKIKEYDFSKKLRFLYVVGPHFEYLHKNFRDFVDTMIYLKNKNVDFEIVVTLGKEQLHKSILWDKNLDKNTNFLGYISKSELMTQFQDNTILISTSVIETLGLHVIEAVQNGIFTIVPNEKYSLDVYGNDIVTYELFDYNSLNKVLETFTLLNNNEIKDIIARNQHYLVQNENIKYQNIVNIFDEILKDKNV